MLTCSQEVGVPQTQTFRRQARARRQKAKNGETNRRFPRSGLAHNSYPLSFSLIGGAGGRIKGDRFIIAPEWTPIANVWLSVASMFGSRIESIGESTGPFQL